MHRICILPWRFRHAVRASDAPPSRLFPRSDIIVGNYFFIIKEKIWKFARVSKKDIRITHLGRICKCLYEKQPHPKVRLKISIDFEIWRYPLLLRHYAFSNVLYVVISIT